MKKISTILILVFAAFGFLVVYGEGYAEAASASGTVKKHERPSRTMMPSGTVKKYDKRIRIRTKIPPDTLDPCAIKCANVTCEDVPGCNCPKRPWNCFPGEAGNGVRKCVDNKCAYACPPYHPYMRVHYNKLFAFWKNRTTCASSYLINCVYNQHGSPLPGPQLRCLGNTQCHYVDKICR